MATQPDLKFRRIGVRLVNRGAHEFMYGYDAEVYDVETGDFIQTIKADIHISASSLITATIEVEVAEVTIREAEK